MIVIFRDVKLQTSQSYGKDVGQKVPVSDRFLGQDVNQLTNVEQDHHHQQQQEDEGLLLTPPSRSGSRATLASLSSFSLNPIPSPGKRYKSKIFVYCK